MSSLNKNNYDDVGMFHEKFGVPFYGDGRPVTPLDETTYEYRESFMQEELDEFKESRRRGDMAGMADALVDLVYVAMGTGHMMSLPWQQLWDEVQRANMAKERAVSADDSRSKRKNSLDVVKPAGWTPPDIQGVLDRNA